MRRRQFPFKDAQSFSQLWEQAYLTVYRYIYSLRSGPVKDIEDLTAETLWRGWRARQMFEGNLPAAIGFLLKSLEGSLSTHIAVIKYEDATLSSIVLHLKDKKHPWKNKSIKTNTSIFFIQRLPRLDKITILSNCF